MPLTPVERARHTAEQLYLTDPRWRAIVDSTTYAALDSSEARRGPYDLARKAALLMLGRIFCESGELASMQLELEAIRERLLTFANTQPIAIILPPKGDGQ